MPQPSYSPSSWTFCDNDVSVITKNCVRMSDLFNENLFSVLKSYERPTREELERMEEVWNKEVVKGFQIKHGGSAHIVNVGTSKVPIFLMNKLSELTLCLERSEDKKLCLIQMA